MSTHILYIPGLGDTYDTFRGASLKWWNLWGVTAKLAPITWYDGASFDEKYQLVKLAVENSNADRVVLVGESAGATLALHVGENESRVCRVITLCGVARSNTPVSNHLRRRAPALDQGVNTLPDSFKVDVQSVRAFADGVVNRKYSVAKGATEHVLWSVGHLSTIALCLTILAPIIINIAKKP